MLVDTKKSVWVAASRENGAHQFIDFSPRTRPLRANQVFESEAPRLRRGLGPGAARYYCPPPGRGITTVSTLGVVPDRGLISNLGGRTTVSAPGTSILRMSVSRAGPAPGISIAKRRVPLPVAWPVDGATLRFRPSKTSVRPGRRCRARSALWL